MISIPREDWQVVISWVYNIVDTYISKHDHTMVIAVAGLIRKYYEINDWSKRDGQLVVISAYRLVVGFSEGIDYTHSFIARLCEDYFTKEQVAEYQCKVWKRCGYDIVSCIRDYKEYHDTYKVFVPTHIILRSLLYDVKMNIQEYINQKVDYSECIPETIAIYKKMGLGKLEHGFRYISKPPLRINPSCEVYW